MGRQQKNQAVREYDPAETPFPFVGEKEGFLIGWPGYRTRPEKFGLAYVESEAELGHMQGVIFRSLLTGRQLTNNPIYQAVLFLVGLTLAFPLVPILFELSRGNTQMLTLLLLESPYLAAGVLLLVNFARFMFGAEQDGSLTGD
jgi:hypothetical protein